MDGPLSMKDSTRNKNDCARPCAPWGTAISPRGTQRLKQKPMRFITRAPTWRVATTG